MKRHRVLITGIGGNIGQGVLKSLRAGDLPFYAVGIDMEPLSAGFSLVDKYAVVPRTSSPEFKSALNAILSKEKIEAIYVCSPTELPFFSSNKDRLEKEFSLSVFVNPSKVITTGEDKLETARFLENAGFPYPVSAAIDDAAGVKKVIETCGFPLIVKPRKGFSAKNIFVVHSEKQIEAAKILVEDLIVQQFLSNGEAEYTAGTISGPDGKVRASIILHRHLLQGTTYRTERVEDRGLTEQVNAIVNALGCTAACNLQFRVEKGKPVVFEINPRFSGTSGIRYHYGFNEAEMIFRLCRLGEEITQPALKPGVSLRYWNEIYIDGADFLSLRTGKQPHNGIQIVLQEPAGKGKPG